MGRGEASAEASAFCFGPNVSERLYRAKRTTAKRTTALPTTGGGARRRDEDDGPDYAELENIDNRRFPEDSSRHKQTPFSSEERQRRARVRATARATTPSAMSSNGNSPASASPPNHPGAKRAIPGLLTEIVITHILKKDHFPDPGDLAQLRVVSREMRDAVDATGRTMEELEDNDYVRLGCVKALQRKHRAGRLSVCPAERRSVEKICQAAATVGNLALLRILRAEGYPWDPYTCCGAAAGGHLEVLK